MFSKSIVALITPFDGDNNIDYLALASLLEWHISSGTHGIVLAGTTGESATLSNDEKVALTKAALEITQGRLKVLVGNGSNNTAESIALTQRLNTLAIDGFLTVTPYYNKPTQAGLFAHFSAIAQVSKHPIILYNVPSRTLCDMSNELVVQLSELNNIVGLKDATADLSRVQRLRRVCKDDFALLSGDDATALAYCLAGGDGVISVTANIAPQIISEIQVLIAQKNATNYLANINKAIALDNTIAALHQGLFIEPNPTPVKWALYWMNKLSHANLRLPLLTLSEQAQGILEQQLKNSGIKQYPQER
jgi:4-hydroxy-tetrahydrodipicolinate synthase